MGSIDGFHEATEIEFVILGVCVFLARVSKAFIKFMRKSFEEENCAIEGPSYCLSFVEELIRSACPKRGGRCWRASLWLYGTGCFCVLWVGQVQLFV